MTKIELYSRKFLGEDCWVLVYKEGDFYEVYETKDSGNDDHVGQFKSLQEAIDFADNLT